MSVDIYRTNLYTYIFAEGSEYPIMYFPVKGVKWKVKRTSLRLKWVGLGRHLSPASCAVNSFMSSAAAFRVLVTNEGSNLFKGTV
jgi:hypothetical protein